jgi:hypothetical protein
MPADTRRKFEFMTLAEEDLRDDLQRFMVAGCRPSDFGPKVRVHPRASWLRPTAKNRMQESTGASYDFSGINRQTTVFDDNPGAKAVHEGNLAHTERFLKRLGEEKAEPGNRNSVVWRAVRFAKIREFLDGFHFHANAQFFSEMGLFLEWYQKNEDATGYGAWNVVVAGTQPEGDRCWNVPGGTVGRVLRTRLPARSAEGSSVSIGVLRDPLDLLADADIHKKVAENLNNESVREMRENGGVGGVPQLLLYLIDKDSSPQSGGTDRAALKAGTHIVGVSIWLPSSREPAKQYVTHLTVKIPAELAGTEDELGNSAE